MTELEKQNNGTKRWIEKKHRKDELLSNVVRKMDSHIERVSFDPYITFKRSNYRTY